MSTITRFILAGMTCTIVGTLLFLAAGRAKAKHLDHDCDPDYDPDDDGIDLPIPPLPQGWAAHNYACNLHGKRAEQRYRITDNAPPLPEGHPDLIVIPEEDYPFHCSFDEYKAQMRKLLSEGKRERLEQCYPGLDLDWFMQDADSATPIQKETC